MKKINITEEDLDTIHSALSNQYDSNLDQDHEMLQEAVNDCDYEFANSITWTLTQSLDALKIVNKYKSKLTKDESDEKKTNKGVNSI